ncbi:hypothetical protein NDU88_006293 [Pleurodeles waltl]|uniref:Uncharacterized protein n=1 Tax=Pleurodeles waltl TaxID=8319 RepID=A0AAV7QKY2_PLEWA|nr:hypothetical protein NDU88_006293 [Pleurodeles waltl]
MRTELTNFKCPRGLPAVVAEVGDGGGEPVPLVPLSYNRALLKADDNGPLDTSNFAGSLSLASLHLSAPSSSVQGQSILSEGRSRQLPQGPVPLGNAMFTQDSEIAQCDQAAAIHPLAGADLRAPVCTLGATRNSRQDCLALGVAGENFYSLSDKSRDSDKASTSSLTDSETYTSSTAPLTPTSMLRRTAIKCHERQGEVANSDKSMEPNEKRKKKKNARGVRAMS